VVEFVLSVVCVSWVGFLCVGVLLIYELFRGAHDNRLPAVAVASGQVIESAAADAGI